jgi:hypothetical protein
MYIYRNLQGRFAPNEINYVATYIANACFRCLKVPGIDPYDLVQVILDALTASHDSNIAESIEKINLCLHDVIFDDRGTPKIDILSMTCTTDQREQMFLYMFIQFLDPGSIPFDDIELDKRLHIASVYAQAHVVGMEIGLVDDGLRGFCREYVRAHKEYVQDPRFRAKFNQLPVRNIGGMDEQLCHMYCMAKAYLRQNYPDLRIRNINSIIDNLISQMSAARSATPNYIRCLIRVLPFVLRANLSAMPNANSDNSLSIERFFDSVDHVLSDLGRYVEFINQHLPNLRFNPEDVDIDLFVGLIAYFRTTLYDEVARDDVEVFIRAFTVYEAMSVTDESLRQLIRHQQATALEKTTLDKLCSVPTSITDLFELCDTLIEDSRPPAPVAQVVGGGWDALAPLAPGEPGAGVDDEEFVLTYTTGARVVEPVQPDDGILSSGSGS